MSDQSPRLQLPLLAAGQAQKEVFHNEALLALDALVGAAVTGPPRADPPETPQPGAAWIVAPGATADWTGHDGALAAWTSGGWRFLQPPDGALVWRMDTGQWTWRNNGAWAGDAFPVPSLAVNGRVVVGAQQPAIAAPAGGAVADGEARAALSAVLTALRNHGLIAS